MRTKTPATYATIVAAMKRVCLLPVEFIVLAAKNPASKYNFAAKTEAKIDSFMAAISPAIRLAVYLIFATASCFAADNSGLVFRLKFEGTNSALGNQVILDASGSGLHAKGVDPSNWITIQTNGPNGYNFAVFVTNNPYISASSTWPAGYHPMMTDAPEYNVSPNRGQIIPDLGPTVTIPSTGHRYAFSNGPLLVSNLPPSIVTMTEGTIAIWLWHIHKDYNTATFPWDTAYNPNGTASYTNCWSLRRDHADRLKFIVYQKVTTDSDGDTIVQWPQDQISGLNTGTGAWHHYAVTFNCSANRAIAYYDGVATATNSIVLPPYLRTYGFATYPYMMLGAAAHSGNPEWGSVDQYPNDGAMHGYMADPRLYVLEKSASDITAIYNGTIDTVTKLQASGGVTITGGVQ